VLAYDCLLVVNREVGLKTLGNFASVPKDETAARYASLHRS
jgi:hypothetical protein